MLFEDVFYPGNPQRRREVSDLQSEIKMIYTNFKTAWNELAGIFNPALKKNLSLSSSRNLKFRFW